MAAGSGFFTVSRLDVPKRVHLLIEAMRHVEDTTATLRIAGTGPEWDSLEQLASGDPRVTLLGGISDGQLIQEYEACRAVPFVPIDEDLGLVTLEAHHAAKPVITCFDSGGVAELVEDEISGLVVAPEPRAVGSAMTRLHADESHTSELGYRGHQRASARKWSTVLTALLRPPDDPRRRGHERRPRLVALSTYPAAPDRHGGQVRVRRLLTALARHADVELLCFGSETRRDDLTPGLVQRSFAPDAAFHDAHRLLDDLTGAPAGDLTASLFSRCLGELPHESHRAIHRADGVIACQPYLTPLVPDGAPMIYDAQNGEGALKAEMYRPTPAGRALAQAVCEIETETVRRSLLVTAASATDLALLAGLTPTMAPFDLVPNGCDAQAVTYVEGRERIARREEYLRHTHGQGLAPHRDSWPCSSAAPTHRTSRRHHNW